MTTWNLFVPCFVAAAGFWVFRYYRREHSLASAAEVCDNGGDNDRRAHEDVCTFLDEDEYPLEPVRTLFGQNVRIQGWPSTGGVWVKNHGDSVELDFLGLSRFEPTPTQRHTDPDAEDAFCRRLELIGAQFYQDDFAYRRMLSSYHYPTLNVQLWYGWPGKIPDGGVWALRASYSQGAGLGVSRIRNAWTMEERCRAIEMLGGKFYERWEDAKLLQGNGSEEHAEL